MTNDMREAIKEAFGTDPDKAVKVDLTIIQCPHIDGETISKRTIELKPWYNGKRKVGWLGYCYTCGKTYYKYDYYI